MSNLFPAHRIATVVFFTAVALVSGCVIYPLVIMATRAGTLAKADIFHAVAFAVMFPAMWVVVVILDRIWPDNVARRLHGDPNI